MDDNNFQTNTPQQQPQPQFQQPYQEAPQQVTEPQPPVEQKASAGLAILSFFVPIAGLIIFIVNRKSRPKTSKACGICALVSFLISLICSLLITLAGGALFATAVDDAYSDINDIASQIDEGTYDYSDDDAIQADGNTSEDGNTIGDYACVIKNATITKNWEGKDSLEVTYDFTNNSDSAASFDIVLDAQLYQDGIALESTFESYDDDIELFDAEIKPGVTKEVKKLYELRNTTSEVEVEISETFSLTEEKITTTISLGN